MFQSVFKQTNIDFDKSTVYHLPDSIIMNTYFIPEDEACPICGSSSLSKNGHVKKTIKHCTYYTKLILLKCNFQLYKCKKCGHIFQESNLISPPNLSLSYESIYAILEQLKYPNESFINVAREMHISKQDVINVFDTFYKYSSPITLPDIISFDEKHIGKAISDRKYIFIMLDWKTKKIYDILPSRDKNTLYRYFNAIPREERLKVQYITIDMWETYRDVSKTFFRNAKIAIDSFHVMENINRAMNKVRCSIMAKYNQRTENIEDNHIYYYLLKKFDYFFTMEFDDLQDVIRIPKLKTKYHKTALLKYLFSIDERLEEAYRLTAKYREFNRTANINNCAEEIETIIDLYTSSKLEQFNDLGNMIINWKDEILNSFTVIKDCFTIPKKKDEIPVPRRLSNGPIEGINSIIEQIKINGKGYTNFDRFKRRVIYSINKELILSNRK